MTVCLNPSCQKEFKPGHYGKGQRVCRGTFVEKCRRCPGKDCAKCHGKGTYIKTCRLWYKAHQLATSQPPRGLGEAWDRIAKKLHTLPPGFAALVEVARASGLRKGELLALTWSDVLDRGKARSGIQIRGTWKDRLGFKPTKTHASRIGMLTAPARAAIEKLRRSAPNAPPTARLWPWTCSTTWRTWTRFQKGIHVVNPETGKPFRFHDLRHTIGSELVAAKEYDTAQKMLGHKNLSTTMRYAVRTADEYIEIAERVRKNL